LDDEDPSQSMALDSNHSNGNTDDNDDDDGKLDNNKNQDNNVRKNSLSTHSPLTSSRNPSKVNTSPPARFCTPSSQQKAIPTEEEVPPPPAHSSKASRWFFTGLLCIGVIAAIVTTIAGIGAIPSFILGGSIVYAAFAGSCTTASIGGLGLKFFARGREKVNLDNPKRKKTTNLLPPPTPTT